MTSTIAAGRHAIARRLPASTPDATGRDERRNTGGTFTFASLDDYDGRAGRRRSRSGRGNPLVAVLARAARLLSAGRHPRARRTCRSASASARRSQTHIGRLAEPRAARWASTWSPFKSGKTTVRAGGGVFYDWLRRADLRADAPRRRHAPARSRRSATPAIPIRSPAATRSCFPPAARAVAPDLDACRSVSGPTSACEQTRRADVRVNVVYVRGAARPVPRPQRQRAARGRHCGRIRHSGNVTEVAVDRALATGTRSHRLQPQPAVAPDGCSSSQLHASADQRRTTPTAPFSLPANNYDLAAEWGPAPGDAAAPRVEHAEHDALEERVRSWPRRSERAVGACRTTSRPDSTTTATRSATIGPPASAATAPAAAGRWDAGARLS